MIPDNALSVSRHIKAPRAAVWQAWADPRQFEQWWIPAPIACRVEQMDLHPGGGFETLMSQDGDAFKPHVLGCFLEVAPQERIVFTTLLRDGWQPIEPWLALTAIITMQDEGSGTRYVARALHRNAAESRKHDEMGFQEGWGTAIDQLARLAEAAQPCP
jgi:uncharacterized protein YndB with AHSA1/START domain